MKRAVDSELHRSMSGGWRRVSVVGTSAAGKSTLCEQIAPLLDLPLFPLDEVYFVGPGWRAMPRDEFRERVGELAEGDRWIIDGNYSTVRDLVWARATDVIWLDLSFPVVFSRALTRTVKRIRDQQELYAGNRETFTRSFLNPYGIPWWVLRTFHARRFDISRAVKRTEGPTVHRLRRRRDVDELVERLRVEFGRRPE